MKLLKFWKEVPKEKYMELKEKIFEVIYKFSNGPPLVLNRLCIAVCVKICNFNTFKSHVCIVYYSYKILVICFYSSHDANKLAKCVK